MQARCQVSREKLTQAEIDSMIDAAEGRYRKANCQHTEALFIGMSGEVPFGKCINCDEIVKMPSGGIID